MSRKHSLVIGLSLAVFAQPLAAQTALPKTLSENAADLSAGRTTSVALVQAYLNRIAAIDDAGPRVNAVIIDRKSTRLNSSHRNTSRMPSSA